MSWIHAQAARLPSGWTENVRLRVENGRVGEVSPGGAPQAGDERADLLVPALNNVHSHAFQRAMAGFAERRGPGADSFWSWRDLMYRVALSMSPEAVEAVAAQAYAEMLEAGFARVGEFHYLHHAPDGSLYDDPAELAARVAAAGAETGIGLTLLPVFYARSGFGGAPASPEQRRFVCGRDAYETLVARCRGIASGVEGATVGVAPHSLRAVTPDELTAAIALAENGPVHIHVAEQTREVEDCVAWGGARPVAWLLDHAPVDERWCLIHATHMTDAEAVALARTRAVAGLCPITEANLGDGTFSFGFVEAGGAVAVGSDSNVLIDAAGELRQLEYSQRLVARARNVFAAPGGSTGAALFDAALVGGAQALGAATGLTVGAPADLVALDRADAPFVPAAYALDHWIFARGVRVDRVWARGRRVVENGRHVRRDAIRARFHAAMRALAPHL